MAGEIEKLGPRIVLEYKNKKPLDLLELTIALKAVGEQFRRYAAREFDQRTGVRLAVGRIDTGSVITSLVPILEFVDMVAGHRDYVGPFVAQFGDVMDMIRSFPPKARSIPKSDVRAAKDVVKPVARDPGGQLNIYGAEGTTIITNVYNFGASGAQTLRKNADIILGGLPAELDFQAEPMILHQLRDGPARAAGDYGFIDRFSANPVRIRWLSDEAKAAVLDRPENVFDLVYFVSGTAKTAGGDVVTFDIRRLDGVEPKPPHRRHV